MRETLSPPDIWAGDERVHVRFDISRGGDAFHMAISVSDIEDLIRARAAARDILDSHFSEDERNKPEDKLPDVQHIYGRLPAWYIPPKDDSEELK